MEDLEVRLRDRVAKNVRALMKQNSQANTQKKLAARSGLAQSTVNRILQAEQDTGIETIAALAKALNVSMTDIIMDDEDAEKATARPLSGDEALDLIAPYVSNWSEEDFIELMGALKAYRKLKQ